MIYRSSRARSHRTGARAWTELYPAGKSLAMVSSILPGKSLARRSAVDAIDPTGLLMSVDRMGPLARMGQPQILHKRDGRRAVLCHTAYVVVPTWKRRTP